MATQTIGRGTITLGAAAAGDSFYFTGGGAAITGNMDYSGVNTSVLAEIGRDFTGSIGTAADPWQTAFSSYLIYNAGAGDLYFESDALDTETTAIVANWGGGHLHFVNAGIATRYEQTNGQTTAGNGVTITTGRFTGGIASLMDTGSGAAVTLLQVGGASVYSQRPHTTIDLMSGTLVLDQDGAGGVNAQGTVNVWGGKLVIKDCGTITKINLYSGHIDANPLSRPMTVTAIDINMMSPGAQALLDNTLVTYSTAPTFTGTTSKRLMTDGRQL